MELKNLYFQRAGARMPMNHFLWFKETKESVMMARFRDSENSLL